MMFFYRNILILILFLLLLDGAFAYNFGYIKINYKESSKTYNFHINKVENYTYYLTFEHYGNIDSDMGVKIYINGEVIYSIEGDGRGFTWDVKKVKVDVTKYLNNGSNTLRIEGVNLRADLDRKYYPYYVLDNVKIDEPFTFRVPVSIVQVIICLITTLLVSIRYLRKYRLY